MVTTELGTQPASAGEKLQHLFETALGRVARMWRAARNRRAVAKLLEWDDRALRDIGLTSGDVRSAMAGRVRDDPSYRLLAMSVERRSAIQAIASENLGRVESVKAKKLPSRSYPFPDL
jgi:uncharacterized protein YjiS (DUF1127 family)